MLKHRKNKQGIICGFGERRIDTLRLSKGDLGSTEIEGSIFRRM